MSTEFVDPWQPTREEVRRWAYDPDPEADPCEDWELALCWVTGRSEVESYVAFAADPRCPTRTFFLYMLYFLVERSVRDGRDDAALLSVAEAVATHESHRVRLWSARSRSVLGQSSHAFDGRNWGDLIHDNPPPSRVNGNRLLHWKPAPRSQGFRDPTDDPALVRQIAICEPSNGRGFFIYGCDEEWRVVEDEWAESEADAMARGDAVSEAWRPASVPG